MKNTSFYGGKAFLSVTSSSQAGISVQGAKQSKYKRVFSSVHFSRWVTSTKQAWLFIYTHNILLEIHIKHCCEPTDITEISVWRNHRIWVSAKQKTSQSEALLEDGGLTWSNSFIAVKSFRALIEITGKNTQINQLIRSISLNLSSLGLHLNQTQYDCNLYDTICANLVSLICDYSFVNIIN